MLFDKSQPAEAEPHFRAAIAANPRYTEALFFLGRTELALNRPHAAVETLRKVIAIDPNYFQAHYVLGTVLRQLGQTAEAKREQKLSVDIQEKTRTEAIKKNESQ
jgi:tetratricopeptide (TPR) repeat protein